MQLLFNVVLDIAIIRYKVETWRNMFDKYSQIMAFADVVILGRRLKYIEEVFTSLVEQTNKIVLEIHEKRQNFW
jgi:cellobiose-specific phosphotransferase system component IIB